MTTMANGGVWVGIWVLNACDCALRVMTRCFFCIASLMSLLKRKVQAYPAPAATSSPVKLTEKDLVPIAEFATHIKTGRLSSGLKPWLASHPNFLSDYYEARLQQAIPYFFNSGNAAQGRSYAHGSPPPLPPPTPPTTCTFPSSSPTNPRSSHASPLQPSPHSRACARMASTPSFENLAPTLRSPSSTTNRRAALARAPKSHAQHSNSLARRLKMFWPSSRIRQWRARRASLRRCSGFFFCWRSCSASTVRGARARLLACACVLRVAC